jgi:acyl-ACP thioesterase
MITATPVREKELTIGSYFVDNRQRLTVPALLGLMQEIAWEHSTSYNAGWNFLQSINLFWALSKMYLKINRLPLWNEVVILRTWGKQPENVIFHRDFEMCDAQGNMLLTATSAWATLSTIDGKVQRMPAEVTHRIVVPENRHAIREAAPKVKKISVVNSPCWHPVLHSDIDMNQHVNNTRYVQWALNNFSHEFQNRNEIKELVINYLSQTKIGDFYAIEQLEEIPKHFISLIYAQNGNTEICKVESFWKES